MTRVLVTGGRDYANERRVAEAMQRVHAATPITLLIHGAADGADSLAATWAGQRGIPLDPHPADWSDIDTPPVRIKVGKNGPYNALAGFKRNIDMLEMKPDLVVAFAGGRGTEHCTQQALKRGIPVMEIDA